MTNTRRTWAQAWTQTEELLPSGLWLQTVSGYDLKRPWCPLVAKKLNYISVRHSDHNETSSGLDFLQYLRQYASNLTLRDNFRVYVS